MPLSFHRTFLVSLAMLLMTACGSKAATEDSSREAHEALLNAIAEVKTNTGVTKTNTELLKVGLSSAQTEFTKLGNELNTSLTGLTADLATVKGGAGALQTAAIALQADTTALRSNVTALQTQLSAAVRYSKTCNPSTDTWLRSAWPGLSDAEITDACRRDGRWHYLGTMRDLITLTLSLPENMQVGLTSYSKQVIPVTVNSWNQGTRFCTPPLAVGDVDAPNTNNFIYQCLSIMNNRFTVTHNRIDGSYWEYSQRNYTNYAEGNEGTLPCTASGSVATCGLSQAFASYWQIYVRQ